MAALDHGIIEMNVFDGILDIEIGRADLKTFEIEKGATRPKLTLHLYQNGVRITDLTAATLSMFDLKDGEEILNDQAIDIIDSNQSAQYDWAEGGTAADGVFLGRVTIAYGGDATVQPIVEKILIKVTEQF